MYVYIAGWNFPGCLPDNPPAVFDNSVAAYDWMSDELIRIHNAEYVENTGTVEFSNAAYDCELRMQSGVIGEDDWSWQGPDGLVYFVECHDWTEDEWREYQESER